MSFLVDVALGMLLIWWLYRDNHITMLANTLVPAADVSVLPRSDDTKNYNYVMVHSTSLFQTVYKQKK